MRKYYLNAFGISGLMLLFFSACSFAVSSDKKIDNILSSKKKPGGVVFEVVSGKNALRWAIPKIQAYVKRLRKKWPGIKIAVVSHGSEQFALQKNKQLKFKKVHQQVKNLTGKLSVPVHICETHASWRGVTPEDFPKFISVSTQGPSEIKNYQEFGYILVVVSKN